MSERPFISSALGGRPTAPFPNAGTVVSSWSANLRIATGSVCGNGKSFRSIN
jgi:hypothetical protein